MSLPPGFTAIKDISTAGTDVSLIGVLIHAKEVFKSRGDDWVLEFTIQDEFGAAAVGGSSSLRCKIFRREESLLPKVGATGDLVLVRNIRIVTFNHSFEAVSSARYNTSILFFAARNIPMPELSAGYDHGGQEKLIFTGTNYTKNPTPGEQMAIIRMKAATGSSVPQVKAYAARRPLESTYKNKRALIQDITFSKFYDIVGEVVKIYPSTFDTLDLYVTDYTVNKDLFLYEDPNSAEYSGFGSSKWQGPFGQITMVVRLWEPHTSYARENVCEGDLIHLNNVHAKLSQANKLEGALHQDQKYPNRVQVRKVTYNKLIEEHEARKKEYLDQHELDQTKQHVAHMNERHAKKPSAKASVRKKEERKEKERLRKEKEKEQKRLEMQAEEKLAARAGVNDHIRASHPQVQFSTVDEIMHNTARKITNAKGIEYELPFVNAKYRTRLRVVDFSPSLLDFTRSMADPAWNKSIQKPGAKDKRRDDRWQWAFVLLVEEADVSAGSTPERFPLFVNNDAGQYLLNMSAVDLRMDADGRTLKRLEEKLFILWGNLLELKNELRPKAVKFPLPTGDERLQNKPFECCIEEYGAKVPVSEKWVYGWQRMHKIAHTTIMDGL